MSDELCLPAEVGTKAGVMNDKRNTFVVAPPMTIEGRQFIERFNHNMLAVLKN